MKREMTTGLSVLLLLNLAAGISLDAAAGEAPNCRTQPVEMIELDLEGFVPFGGSATVKLCQRPRGLTATVLLEGAENQNVYSAWWIFRTRPMNCVNPSAFGFNWSCDGALFATEGEDGEWPVVGRLGSSVANRGGSVRWRDSLHGFSPPAGSAIVILIQDHGKAQWRDSVRLARQRLTPEQWVWGEPGPGNFFDFYSEPFMYEIGWTQFVIE